MSKAFIVMLALISSMWLVFFGSIILFFKGAKLSDDIEKRMRDEERKQRETNDKRPT